MEPRVCGQRKNSNEVLLNEGIPINKFPLDNIVKGRVSNRPAFVVLRVVQYLDNMIFIWYSNFDFLNILTLEV